MKSALAAALAALSLFAANPAAAALAVGAAAPTFAVSGADNGKAVTVDLAALLKQGPVVLYFFPSAFTESAETREFAENIDKFRAAGASVVGMSRDSIDTLKSFSVDTAAGKFAVASADESLVNAFEVNDGAMFQTRTTYVIAPSGKIAFVHDDPDHLNHVGSALAFVRGMKK